MTTTDRTRTEAVLDLLRREPDHPAVLRGFGPLVVGVLLALLMVLLLPSVAPERIVERPADAPAEGVGE